MSDESNFDIEMLDGGTLTITTYPQEVTFSYLPEEMIEWNFDPLEWNGDPLFFTPYVEPA